MSNFDSETWQALFVAIAGITTIIVKMVIVLKSKSNVNDIAMNPDEKVDIVSGQVSKICADVDRINASINNRTQPLRQQMDVMQSQLDDLKEQQIEGQRETNRRLDDVLIALATKGV